MRKEVSILLNWFSPGADYREPHGAWVETADWRPCCEANLIKADIKPFSVFPLIKVLNFLYIGLFLLKVDQAEPCCCCFILISLLPYRKKSSLCFTTELTFNNCIYNSSANSSSAVGPTSCSPTPPSTGTNWVLPWQQQRSQRPQQGLNNEEDFFNTQPYFSNLSSTATTFVNNRGGFYPTLANNRLTGNPFESTQFSGKSQGGGGGGVEVPPSTVCLPGGGGGGGNGSSSSSTAAAPASRITSNSVQAAAIFPLREEAISTLNRRSSTTECVNKPVRPSSDTNVISLTDNPGAPMLKTDSTLSLDAEARSRACCFCWCCCCSCSW